MLFYFSHHENENLKLHRLSFTVIFPADSSKTDKTSVMTKTDVTAADIYIKATKR